MKWIKVVAHQPEPGETVRLHHEHPDRIVVNFEMGDDGGPAYPMRYEIWSHVKLTESEVAAMYEELRAGAVVGELENGIHFARRAALHA